ncbi:MAG: Phosphate regulon transcriptional regulatory protein PhoB [Fimbriimonadales bacterium]|nr:MAG: DNA-binding response regulator [Armatimonadota bacterium]MBV6502525.1 Phosphate regulon transcriptional regulatory protein PhoB [Fimbriimonadales bacterium]MCE7898632.1 DNA-binding response regulator [Armatimonadetes bacterium ATM1]MDL1928075.1 response regulator transcription factor [Fimbriimonadia bacterium ATM]MBC6968529.1 DNA-binding response regulator [Armatimonadota bacterium]
MKILVVDDDPDLLETVSRRLRRDGFDVVCRESAEGALATARQDRPDLIVLDVMLPGRSGFDLAKVLTSESKVPILFLSARASAEDRITGFESGGDDYLTKPFHLAELSARVQAILRRTRGVAGGKEVVRGSLRIDPDLHEAWIGDTKLDLKPKEFALLHFLASNPEKVFSREALLDRVWGPDAYVTPRTVDVHVSWLRKQLEAVSDSPQIVTVRRVGYRLQ